MVKPKSDLIAVREKLQQTYGEAPSYAQIWLAAANGRIPARRVGRTWQVDDADLAIVAKHFGLKAPAPASVA
jgi:hypothetical protein